MPVDYIPLNIGIDFGSDYLTNEVAYFLGGILAANEHTINNGQTFWIAPFRSNPAGLFSALSKARRKQGKGKLFLPSSGQARTLLKGILFPQSCSPYAYSFGIIWNLFARFCPNFPQNA